MPWPERVGNSGLMEKMKELEKDEAVASGVALKGNGVVKKAWPVACSRRVPLVKAKRPDGLNSAMPARVRFGEALKLLNVKLKNEEEIESLMNLVQKQSGEVQQLSKQNEQAIKRSEDLVNLLTLSRRQEWHLKLIVLALAVICFPMFSKYYNVPSDKFLALP
ncbi:hypothetical protein RHSIM_Rhsim04G0159400 [Rhododendron simsii]|uniref:Uncharacterized protein n=1 Tax=Rhododendron simsii TaxID=118357 RepID=A0A834H0B7_RHOSS|nr:hypothetical protein RHSIM_Rhsim04G0159400 [Rhododendron simsii]